MNDSDKQIMDGCTAATHIAYALSEVATIYPITPIASMGETADKWALQGRLNIWGRQMEVKEMESELGAAGATHGAAAAGALATTFTASQGLLLMIPNMYKIAGELLPVVFHVGTRSVAAHALSIFGDHQDVMACRGTGFSMLASGSVQEVMDLGLVAHLAAIEGRVPVLHFFDGWRTSNEISTIETIPYDTIAQMVNGEKVAAFKASAMNPDHPDMRGTAQNPDVYFQFREAANPYYERFPAIVQNAMDRVAAATGRSYHLFDYTGDPDADRVIVIMGSGAEVASQTSEALNRRGEHTGVVNVRLFRPFSAEALMQAIPASVRSIAVMDRCKEPGSEGEPLLLDVASAVLESRRNINVIGGRYGLSSKDFNPSMVMAVFDELARPQPRRRFTVGITDDVSHLSLQTGPTADLTPSDMHQAIFYGMGSDGTVGATRQIAQIVGAADGMYAQAYFHYSAKKSGGYTISQLRIAPHPVKAAYAIESADYVGCNKDSYIGRFALLEKIKDGGTFVLNTAMSVREMEDKMPAALKRAIAGKHLKFYTIDATSIAAANGLGARINTIMATVYLRLSGMSGSDKAVEQLKTLVEAAYRHEGNAMVKANMAAIDAAPSAIRPIACPAGWATAEDQPSEESPVPEFVSRIARPCMRLQGDSLPVSLFRPDGVIPMGTTAYEKRCIAINVPEWDPEKCVQCTLCSLVCSHAAIRPVVASPAEIAGAPAGFITAEGHDPTFKGMRYRIQVYAADCTGCSSCAVVCPGHALTMRPIATQLHEQNMMLAYAKSHVSGKPELLPRFTVQGSQLQRPLMQFSGACGGCGETPYVKLLTQLFGERMVIANATGCSSIWGANYPSNAYTVRADGRGPAWGNSLFEDNAEYGYGIACALRYRREALKADAAKAAADPLTPPDTAKALDAWISVCDDPDRSYAAGKAITDSIGSEPHTPLLASIAERADLLGSKSIWAIGGDGWAYDIGFAGLDHVAAQNENINILVMDTECYSNTGGQMSKATPLSAVAKYAADGKRTVKKDLGRMMMTYRTVYVASIALGADYTQAITALREAESYPGVSIVIAYCPCIAHGIRSGMGHSMTEQRRAVATGYWPLYRFDPRLEAQGKNPLTIDAPSPRTDSLIDFINGEDRYADLKMVDPNEAAILQPGLRDRCAMLHSLLTRQP